jgi:hypothetical protein
LYVPVPAASVRPAVAVPLLVITSSCPATSEGKVC